MRAANLQGILILLILIVCAILIAAFCYHKAQIHLSCNEEHDKIFNNYKVDLEALHDNGYRKLLEYTKTRPESNTSSNPTGKNFKDFILLYPAKIFTSQNDADAYKNKILEELNGCNKIYKIDEYDVRKSKTVHFELTCFDNINTEEDLTIYPIYVLLNDGVVQETFSVLYKKESSIIGYMSQNSNQPIPN